MVTIMGTGQTIFAYIILMMLSSTIPLHSQDKKGTGDKDMLLAEIATNIEANKSKTITLKLKLKHLDRIFERISFYDRKNHDIVFDISAKETKNRLAPDLRNIHEGMDYFVTFVVRNVGRAGELIADLQGFRPVLLEYIPEGGDKRAR